jgi:CheY-like chemotaxis protein
MKRLKVDLTACRILIVDDTPVNLEVLIDMLESEGFDIGIARDGSEALEVVGMRKPDPILLDVMMPGIDGYETCRRLKAQEEFEEIPVIFLTARADPEGTLEGFAAGGGGLRHQTVSERGAPRSHSHQSRARYSGARSSQPQ